jgi:hypothetical protein
VISLQISSQEFLGFFDLSSRVHARGGEKKKEKKKKKKRTKKREKKRRKNKKERKREDFWSYISHDLVHHSAERDVVFEQ